MTSVVAHVIASAGRPALASDRPRHFDLTSAGQGTDGGLALAAFVSWALTASIGVFMLVTWISQGGLSRRRATGTGPPPALIFGHFGLAVTGLLAWGAYLAGNWAALAWAGAGLLAPAVGLGISTLTLWTPYPGPSTDALGAPTPGPAPAGSVFAERPSDNLSGKLTDEMLKRALTDDALARNLAEMMLANLRAENARAVARPRGHVEALVPVVHGIGAITTIMLVILAVVQIR